jgi:hypothetical protein
LSRNQDCQPHVKGLLGEHALINGMPFEELTLGKTWPGG